MADLGTEAGDASASLQLVDVSHFFGRTRALDEISFNLGRGMTGLLGPNGAGKTTLLNILSTATRPRSGHVSAFGQDLLTSGALERARRRIGYLPQRFDLMARSSCLDNVVYAAWAQGVPESQCVAAATDALNLVNLESRTTEKAKSLSGGQRQRLGIACAVVHQPDVLILDEPTVGLDPAQRADVRTHLQTLARSRAIVLSTHIVEDLDPIADRIVVLTEGRILFDGSRPDLVASNPESGRTLESAYLDLVHRTADGDA